MKPQEKAKELVDKYLLEVRGADRYNYNLESMNVFIAKKCALIAIDEICDAINWHELEPPNKEWDYWNDVKLEIEKL
jgi:hypothetical protein